MRFRLLLILSFPAVLLSAAAAYAETPCPQPVCYGPIATLLFCGFMGLLGQAARSIVGLKTMTDYKTTADAGTIFSLARLITSLIIGFVAGVLTALAIWATGKPNSLYIAVGDFDTMIKFAIAGYIGTDAIEAFTAKYFEPGATTGGTQTDRRPPDDTSGQSPDKDGSGSGGLLVAETAATAAAATNPSTNDNLISKFDDLSDRVSLMDASIRTFPSIVETRFASTGTELPTFSQPVVDACASLSLTKASDLHDLFGGASFFSWYNNNFKGVAETKSRYPCVDTSLKRERFDQFWDQIPVVFGKDSISAIEFSALMAINLEESNGSMAANPEEVNPLHHSHPGLAYPFDAIPGLKQSYNHPPNRTALSLFEDDLFVNAHGTLPGRDRVLTGEAIDSRWGGETWPAEARPDAVEAINGFIMQADFYKFRGRGVIQTTWRSDYKLMIAWLLSNEAASNDALKALAARWRSTTSTLKAAKQIDAIATISSNTDWDTAFGEALTLAKGVSIDSADKGNYLENLSRSATVLGADRKSSGSLLWFASHINGGSYPDRVAPIMKALMRGIAGSRLSARTPRAPDALTV